MQENGIVELNYDLLIDGEDTTVTPEVKPEVKPETKPEVKPETKPEVTPDTNGTVESDKEDTSNNNESNGKLPNTGAPFSSTQVVIIALAIATVGALIINKKENVA